MKRIVGLAIPFIFQHIICCGALLFFLVSSGYLLAFRLEAENRVFLLPGLLVAALVIGIHYYYNRCCKKKGYKDVKDHAILTLLYILISVIVGVLFMIYIFIPSWIPGYKGGPLLP